MDCYAPFEDLCFVDTLDNIEGLRVDVQGELGALTAENTRRIKKQNQRKISVIIGNPPYNANQQNENDNNKNRTYPHIDARIKATYIAASTAQKTKSYDPYLRFIRWASDRISDEGIVSFICNRSFIDARHTDGFRKVVGGGWINDKGHPVPPEFEHVYAIDLGGDYKRPVAGKANVFGIATGVAIIFLVKSAKAEQHPEVHYAATAVEASREEKLSFLSAARIESLAFERIKADPDGNWLDADASNFKTLFPVEGDVEKALFVLGANGIVTARDPWVYDPSPTAVTKKGKFLSAEYNRLLEAGDTSYPSTIKWSRDLKRKFAHARKSTFNRKAIATALYRPYTKQFLYTEKLFVDILTDKHFQMFGPQLDRENIAILTSQCPNRRPYFCLASSHVFDFNFNSDPAYGFSLYRYDAEGERHDNLTDWSLKQFRQQYGDGKITKRDLFHYTYAVLHHPAYRAKYEVNLKREFPRLPFYGDFRQWAKWGRALMELHLGYEQAAPFPLIRHDLKEPASKQPNLLPDERVKPKRSLGLDEKPALKPRLKALKDTGEIEIDATTTLRGIPPAAWDYKLGNRSALEWVLDQWKEHKISDPTVAEKFNTYRFADYKEPVIDLLHRVCTVSVETMKIVRAMPA